MTLHLGIALALLVTGCGGDSTGVPLTSQPAEGTSLVLSTRVESTTLSPVDTIPRITCVVILHASTGTGATGIAWEASVTRFFLGTLRLIPTDSLFMAQAEVSEGFGGGVPPSTERESRWFFYSAFPFTGEVELRYHQGNDPSAPKFSALSRFECGPAPVPTPLPTVTTFTVDPPDGVIPGDSIMVTLSASSPTGIWATAVQLGGPCTVTQRFFERSKPSVNRTFRIGIPTDCTPGQPFIVNVAVADYEVQTVQLSSTLAPPITNDGQKPLLDVRVQDSASVTGDYFAGDNLRLHIVTSDNNRVRSVVWKGPGTSVLDSVLVQSPGATIDKVIVVPQSWGSVPELLFYARDAGGLVSDTVRSTPSFGIHATVTHPIVTNPILGSTANLLEDSQRHVLYVLDPAGFIRIVSNTTALLIDSVTLFTGANDMDFTPSHDSLVVVQGGGLAIVDLTQASRPVTAIPLTVLDPTRQEHPGYLRTAANGRVLLSLKSETGDGWRVAEVNLTNGTQAVRADAGIASAGAVVGRSADHRVLVFNGVQDFLLKYDSDTDVFGMHYPSSNFYIPVVDPTGSRTVLGLGIYDASLAQIASVPQRYIPGPYDPLPPAAFSPDGSEIYHMMSSYNYGYYVYRSDPATGRPIDRFAAPTGSDHVWNTGGSQLIVTRDLGGTTHVSIVDVHTTTAPPSPNFSPRAPRSSEIIFAPKGGGGTLRPSS